MARTVAARDPRNILGIKHMNSVTWYRLLVRITSLFRTQLDTPENQQEFLALGTRCQILLLLDSSPLAHEVIFIILNITDCE